MTQHNNNHNSGFVALISSIIIAAVLVSFALTTSQGQFFTRANMLDKELKVQSRLAAQSCVNITLLHISENYFFTLSSSTDTLTIHNLSCTVQSVVYGVENAQHTKVVTIDALSDNHDVWTHLQATTFIHNPSFALLPLGQQNIGTTSWTELP